MVKTKIDKIKNPCKSCADWVSKEQEKEGTSGNESRKRTLTVLWMRRQRGYAEKAKEKK